MHSRLVLRIGYTTVSGWDYSVFATVSPTQKDIPCRAGRRGRVDEHGLTVCAEGGPGGVGQSGQPGQDGGDGGKGADVYFGVMIEHPATDGADAGGGGFGGSGGSVNVMSMGALAAGAVAAYVSKGTGADPGEDGEDGKPGRDAATPGTKPSHASHIEGLTDPQGPNVRAALAAGPADKPRFDIGQPASPAEIAEIEAWRARVPQAERWATGYW
jgi:hypothetical protein